MFMLVVLLIFPNVLFNNAGRCWDYVGSVTD